MSLTALADSSSLIILFKTGLLDKCAGLYDLLITQSVKSEITRKGYPGSEYFDRLCSQERLNLLSDGDNNSFDHDLSGLDRGERDTISRFLKGDGDFIIIDDGRGADICRRRSLPYINALLIPKILYVKKVISEPEFREYFAGILTVGRYSSEVISFAENCTGNDLKRFIP